jgi:hypothetical protein
MTAKRRPIALTRKELYQRVWSEPLAAVAKELGLSGGALAKICNRLLVPYPPRGYWSRSKLARQLSDRSCLHYPINSIIASHLVAIRPPPRGVLVLG